MKEQPILMKAKGTTDVHYLWLPQDKPVVTVCGVNCDDFKCTNDPANCPDCIDKINGFIETGAARELVPA